MSQSVFAAATLTPTDVLAADSQEFVITLTIGSGYTAGPSRIVLDLPGTVGYSRPSLSHTEDHGYMEAYVSNPDVTYAKRNWDMEITDFASRTKSSWRGMAQRMFVLDLSAGLKEGDTVAIHWGDAGGGFGPGTKVSCVVPRPDYTNTIHVRYFDSPDKGMPDLGRDLPGQPRPVPDAEAQLQFRIRPRPVKTLRVIRQTRRALLVAQDVFANAVPDADPVALVDAPARPAATGMGAFAYADPAVRVASRGLPLLDAPTMIDVHDGYNLYWGDLHSHSAISNDCIEREKLTMQPGDLMAFARDRAGLDFYAVTDHHQPWDVERNKIGRDRWERTIEAVRQFDRPGEFLVFPGIEYRCKRGDTEVLFNWLPTYDEIDRPEWTDIRQLWQGLRGRDYLAIAHFHNGGGLERDEWWQNIAEGVEPVLEIFSCHGSYERPDALEQGLAMNKSFRPDRCGVYFLDRGLRYGLVCNSDDHKGHVGVNGVTAVFAKELTKEAILEAYRARRVYGTTNARIRLVFTANGQLMGSLLPDASDKSFAVDVTGENRLKKVELFRNGQLHHRWAPQGRSLQAELTVRNDGPAYWYLRATQVDNHIAWSSPIWFE